MRRFNLQTFLLPSLLLAAFLLRAWSPGNMAIEHFDEGVYASNLFSDHLDFSYPDREFYAPPLLPAIFEWVLILCGGSPHAVMWVNVVLGTALVGAVFWTSRQLLAGCLISQEEGRNGDTMNELLLNRAALASAALVAFSDLFIQYSRAALTDVPVCLAMTLAVGAGARALARGSWGWVSASGILTAIAWWTKYNGWLPVAILGAGCGGWWLLTKAGRASFFPAAREKSPSESRRKKGRASPAPHREAIPPGLRQLLQCGVIGLIAGLLWLPYLNDLQPHGGYAAIAENHRGYLVGFSGWLDSVQHHLAVDRFYSRESSAMGVLITLGMIWLQPRSRASQRMGWEWLFLLLLPVVLFWTGLIPILCLLAGLVLVTWLCRGRCLKRKSSDRAEHGESVPQEASLTGTQGRHGIGLLTSPPLGLWILLAWIAGLTLSTPLYRPYPRLILPWMIGMSMAAGLGLAMTLRPFPTSLQNQSSNEPTNSGRNWLLVLAIVAAPFLLALTHPVSREVRTGLREGGHQLMNLLQRDLTQNSRSAVPELDAVIYVIAEPGLYYHLAAQEDEQLKYITQPASDLGMLISGKIDPRVPAYLVTGLHARKEANQLMIEALRGDRIRKVGEVPYAPSSLVLLDKISPAELSQQRPIPLQLWSVQQE